MKKQKDHNIRSVSGVLISIQDIGNGKCRLCIDDVINASGSTDDSWKHENRLVSETYDLNKLETLRFPQNQLAEIGKHLLNRAYAKNQTRKTDTQELIKEIRSAFEDAEFPCHMGLIAAEAVDDWACDETLRELTKKNDYHGDWWDIPESHLTRGSLGLNYLDSIGMAFYLPAFMTYLLKKPTCDVLHHLVWELNPASIDNDDEEVDWYSIFCNKFSNIKGQRKRVCVKFLQYMKEELLLCGYRYLDDVENIIQAMQHEFWKTEI